MKIFNIGNRKWRGKKKILYLILFIFYEFFKLLYVFLLFFKIGENNFYYSLKNRPLSHFFLKTKNRKQYPNSAILLDP